MHPYPRFVRALLAALSFGCAARAELSTVFNDTFGSGSTVNNATPIPAVPTLQATAYQQITAKALPSGTPSIAANQLRFGLPSTTSAVNMIEALFTKYPITLANTSESVEMTIVFSPVENLIGSPNSYLFVGLYDGGQVQPKPGGLTASTAGSAGNAQNWNGYVSRIASGTTAHSVNTRPAQGAATANNQDVVYSYSNGAQVGTTATSTLSALAAGSTYTTVLTITKTGAAALDIRTRLWDNANSTVMLLDRTVSSTSIPTGTFDAMAFGFRYNGTATGTTQRVDVRNITVTTTAATTIKPVITTDPFSQTKSVGESVTLTVVASGGGASPLTYQWYKGTTPIDGATADTYSIPSVTLDDAGDYKVVVNNAYADPTTSAVATLTVTVGAVAPSVLDHPDNATILVGGSATFTAQASGTAPLSYQWQFSSDAGAHYSDIPAATGTSYALSNAQLADAGLYRLAVTNSLGTAYSNPATLTVNQVPSVTQPPVGATLAVGDPLNLSVTVLGTPAPTYQWKRNGAAIPGATASTYSVGSVTGADTGNYTVTITNSVGTATSSIASVAVLSSSLAPVALSPNVSGATRNPDARLSMTFNAPVTAGVSGFLRIYDASNDTVVDSIDFVAATALRDTLRSGSTVSTLLLPVQNKTIGGVTNFNYYPLTISGGTVTIYPRNGVLAYGKSYYVKIDAGAFVDSSGLAFAGIADTTTWAFTTKASGPSASATTVTVAADGSGDFDTVQGAIDWVPAANAAPLTIWIKNGTYYEQIVFTNKNYLNLVGQDRTLTTIVYPNNNNFNNVSGFYHRSTFIGSGVHDINVVNLTFRNSTPQGGSQAESFILSGSAVFTARNLVTKCNFYSYQDTVQFSRQCYISDSYIEGDTDFMWGGGPCFFSNCDIKMLRTGAYYSQVRNDSGNHGFIYSNCRFTAGAGFTGNFLGRIDPRPGGFPYSEVVLLNCSIGDATNNTPLSTTVGVSNSDYKAGWWLLNSTTDATTYTANIHNWDYNTVDGTGAPLTFANRPAFTVMPTDATTLGHYADPFWVLNSTFAGVVTGSWTPSLAPILLTQPQGATLDPGQTLTLQVTTIAIPAATYQWYKGVTPIDSATSATYTVASVTAADAGDYSVVVTNTGGSVTSATVAVTVTPPALSPVESWRQSHFGTTANTGSAADSADPDGDGVSNLLEYATGRDPNAADATSLATLDKTGDGLVLTYTFTRIADPDLVYAVQGTDDLSGTPVWTTVASSTGAANVAGPVTVTDTQPISASPRRFLRLQVSHAP